jgi:hypothetical protein
MEAIDAKFSIVTNLKHALLINNSDDMLWKLGKPKKECSGNWATASNPVLLSIDAKRNE